MLTTLPLPKHFGWIILFIHVCLLALYQPVLPIWNTLLFLSLILVQGLRLRQQRAAFTPTKINLLVAPLLLWLLVQVMQLGMLNVMLHILLLATIARSYTLAQREDAHQLLWVNYFALACSFIFYQQISMAMLIFSLLALNLYLQYSVFAAAPAIIQPKRLGFSILFTLPIWLGLFLLFPRIPPLWQMPNQSMATSGLTDRLDPGSIERLVQSDALAFRASFQSTRPPREEWYWRAKVYEDFDGRSWQINSRFAQPQQNLVTSQPETSVKVHYQLLVEPTYQRDLFSLGLPTSWSFPLTAQAAGLLTYPNPVAQRISYQTSSTLQPIPLQSLSEQQLNLRQNNANPQTRRFGQQLAEQYQGDGAAIVEALNNYFQQQPFFYSLTPPRLGNHAVDQFLFESRIGFCSHYASAAAVVLRAAGIPARVIGGYQGGDWQQNQQYLLVRQRDAHAWVEYLLDNQWQRFDPTAAIAPERILEGIEQTLPFNERALLSGWQDNWLGQLALQWSHLDYFWSVWVLGFNQKEQQQLWQSLRHWPYWSALFRLLAITLFIVVLAALAYLLKQQKNRNQPRQLICKALGYQPDADKTVSSWLKGLATINPSQAELLNEIIRLYEQSVFANDAAAGRLLQQRLRQQRKALLKLTRS